MIASNNGRYQARKRGSGIVVMQSDNLNDVKELAASDPSIWLWDTETDWYIKGWE